MMNPARNTTGTRIIIARYGREVVYKRETATGEDALNHDQTTWENQGTTLAARFYGEQVTQETLTSGEYDSDKPAFAIPAGAGVQDGDRLYYDGTTYEIESVTDADTHKVAQTTRV